MVYRSKIGTEIVLITSVLLFLGALPLFVGAFSWLGLSVLIAVAVFIIVIFTTTVYEIKDNLLLIKSGWFKPKIIAIDSITKIAETNSLLSAPAASLDRLEITYGKKDSIIISPKKKQDFIADMQRINPTIRVKLLNR